MNTTIPKTVGQHDAYMSYREGWGSEATKGRKTISRKVRAVC